MDRVSRITSSRASARPITSRPLSSARPITSTGLIAPRTSRGKSGLKRQVQDKSYFMGLLRTKINELSAEIARLSKECENMAKEESRSGVYKRKAEELAQELSVLSKELGVYNEFSERIRISEDENEVKEDIEALKNENKTITGKLEKSYDKKKRLEEIIKSQEQELEKMQNIWNNLKGQFTYELKERYDNLEKLNQELSSDCDQLEKEINDWKDKKLKVEANSNGNDSLIRREILQAVGKLRELEKQREDLTSDASSKGDERGLLLAQVKRDNREVSNMEIKLNEVNEQIQEIKNELDAYEDVNAIQKYQELKQKEETIENFLSEFESNKRDEMAKMQSIGPEINEITGKLSRCLSLIETLKGEGSKESEGKSSLEVLQDEKRKLELDLNKIEQLEIKIEAEIDSLQSKIKKYNTDIEMYSDIPKMKSQIEEKIAALESEKNNLIKMSVEVEKSNNETKSNLDKCIISLDKNELNRKIKNLEAKLADILTSNEPLKEMVNSGMNNNLKNQVLEEVKKYNQRLLGY